MGYGFRFSNAAVNTDNTLRRGNANTTGGHAANPSNNFHAGIGIVSGKHTVVQVFSSGDPDYWSLDDYDLVRLMQSQGASVYTSLEAKNYIKTQSDLFYIDNSAYDNSILEDVLLNLQPGYESSFVFNFPTVNFFSDGHFPDGNDMVSENGSNATNTIINYPGNPGASDFVLEQRKGVNSTEYQLNLTNELSSNKTYVLSGWYAQSADYSGTSRMFHCRAFSSSGEHVALGVGIGTTIQTVVIGGITWKYVYATITFPSDYSNNFNWYVGYDSSTYSGARYYTNLQMEEGTYPTPYLPGTGGSATRSQNTTWSDLSGNNNDATLASAVGMDPGGWITFNGTQTTNYQVAVPIDRTELGDQASVEAIFRYDGASGDGYRPIIGGNDPGAGTEFFLGKNTGNTNFGVQDGNYAGSFVTNYNVFDGEWHHMVYTYSSGEGKLYLDGTLRSTGTFTKANGAEQIYIGAEVQEGYWWDGAISLVRYYTAVLSANEVSHNFLGGSILTDNLVFNVDAGSLTSYESGSLTAYSTQDAIDGTLNNGVDFTFENGGSWVFDGTDDYINFGSDSPIDFIYSDPFSLEIWLNADNTSGFKHLIGKSYADYRLAQNGAGISFRLDSNNLTTQLGTIVAGEWTHIVATWEPSTSTAYVYQDGVLKGSVTDTTVDWTSTGNNFQMGTSPGEAYYVQGKMPIGRAYSKTLSLLEVQQNYNALKPRFPS